MSEIPFRSACFILVSMLAVLPCGASAADENQPARDLVRWTESVGADGLGTYMPGIDAQQFEQRIVTIHSGLRQHATELERNVAEKEFGIFDAVVTAVMPGGLVYAGIRQNDCDQARQALAQARSLLDELSAAILAYQYATGSVVFAQLN